MSSICSFFVLINIEHNTKKNFVICGFICFVDFYVLEGEMYGFNERVVWKRVNEN